MKTKNLLLAVVIVCSVKAAFAMTAQKRVVVKGGEICEENLLKRIARSKAKGSRVVKLRAFKANVRTLSPDLQEWLDNADEEKLVTFELRHKKKKALLLGSRHVRATGLAANFQYWHIGTGSHAIEFISLSEDAGLMFWDKNGLLNYYVVDYGDEFLKDKNWDNLTLNLRRYRISAEGATRLVSEERDVRCK